VIGNKVGVIVAVLLLPGCGGTGGPSASEDYANDVCGHLSAWVADQQDTVKSLDDAGPSITKEDLQVAVDDVRDSTEVLVLDLRELGPPDTDAGNQAKSELDSLGTALTQQVDKVEQALNESGGTLALTTTVTAALSTAARAVESTWNDLNELDPGGELADGFKNADDCKSFSDQVAEIGS
jgi:hypothetical protein